MNNKRRKAINDIVFKLESLKSDLKDILMDEEMIRDNLEEHFSETERHEISEGACNLLQEAIDVLERIV